MNTLMEMDLWLKEQGLNGEEAHTYWVLINCFFEGKITLENYTEKCANILAHARARKEVLNEVPI